MTTKYIDLYFEPELCGSFGCFYNKIKDDWLSDPKLIIYSLSLNDDELIENEQLEKFKENIIALKLFLIIDSNPNSEKIKKKEVDIIKTIKQIFGDNLLDYTAYLHDSSLLKIQVTESNKKKLFRFFHKKYNNEGEVVNKIIYSANYCYAVNFTVCNSINKKIKSYYLALDFDKKYSQYIKFKTSMINILTILHGHKYAHRDIKSQNLIECETNFKLIDYSSMSSSEILDIKGATFRNPKFFKFNSDYIKLQFYNDKCYQSYINFFGKLIDKPTIKGFKTLDSDFTANDSNTEILKPIQLFLTEYKIDLTPIQYIKLKDDEYCIVLTIIVLFIKIDITSNVFSPDNQLYRKLCEDDFIKGLVSELPYFYLLSKQSTNSTITLLSIFDRFKNLIK
jgi:hypothetical protein